MTDCSEKSNEVSFWVSRFDVHLACRSLRDIGSETSEFMWVLISVTTRRKRLGCMDSWRLCWVDEDDVEEEEEVEAIGVWIR